MSNYPTAVDDQTSLLNPVDGSSAKSLATTTSAVVLSGDTTINVASTAVGFAAAYGVLSIEDELVIYTGKTSTSVTGCVRGALGTTAIGHASGVAVKALMCAGYLTELQDAVIATQTALGVTGAFNFADASHNHDAGDIITGVIAPARLGTGTPDGSKFLRDDGVWSVGGGGGGGSVTSVAMTVPSFLSLSGSPITASGTLAVTLANASAHYVLAGPTSGGAAAPTMRALVASDIPDLSAIYLASADLTGFVGGAASMTHTGRIPKVASSGVLSESACTAGIVAPLDIWDGSAINGPMLSIRADFAAAGRHAMIRFGDQSQTATYQKAAIIYEGVASSARGKMHLAVENTDTSANVALGDARVTVLSSGSVGIATTSPNAKLHVVGDMQIDQVSGEAFLYLGANKATSAGRIYWDNNNQRVGLGYNGTDYLNVYGGKVGICTTSPAAHLDVQGPAGASTTCIFRSGGNTSGDVAGIELASLNGTVNSRIFTTPTNQTTRLKSGGLLAFHAGDVGYTDTNEYLTITAGGNVGVGNASPTERLSITGNLLVSGNLKMLSSPIANRNIMMSDGSGTGSWNTLVSGDIPSLDVAKITTGVFDVARLGSGTPVGTPENFLNGHGVWATPPQGTLKYVTAGLDSVVDSSVAGDTATLSMKVQAANLVLCGPAAGIPAASAFRALDIADLPMGAVVTYLDSYYYSRTEIDAGFYTMFAIDTMLSNYYDKSAVDFMFTSYYTMASVDSLLSNYYTMASVNALLAGYYDTAAVDFLLAGYYTKTEINTALGNYYTKAEADARFAPL